MQCDEVRPLLDAYVDGEVDAAQRALLRQHIAGCAECGPEMAALERLRDGIRSSAPVYQAPEALRSAVRASLRREPAPARPAPPHASNRLAPGWLAPGWLAYAASILLALAIGSGGTYVLTGQHQENAIANEVIDSHLRSLLGSHLTDVQSSDKHTVKPWFAGRTDISPPGVDLAAAGFPLIGGRLDLIEGKPVPALVYRADKHIINVFVLPKQPGDFAETLTRRGYTLHHWNEGDIGYWAVSDAAAGEFDKFERAFRQSTGG